MTTKSEKERTKQIQDKCQTVLNALLRDEDNKYCVDCDSKGPRWASWNLGVFLCIRCAGIHRNLGVHISKVKSVNLDSWTPEQVVSLQQMGNSRARAVYEANLPDNFRRPQSDSSLESFIRAKYEQKKYIAREWVPPTLPKVNWEKEIDEELERQKRKKKSLIEQKKTLSISEVPQIPKPRNSASPKPNRISQTEVKPVATTAATDLLGLQNGDDSFTSFLSAPKKEETPQKQNETVKSEEESFFNQPAPSEKEKAKLTKDSILALYGNTPPILQQNNFLAGNPNYQSQFQQQNFTNFPQNNFAVQQNGVPQPQFPAQPALNQFQQMNQFPAAQQGMQFQPMFQAMNQQFATTSQYPVPNPQFSNVAPSSAPANQFQAMGQFQHAAQFSQPQFNAAVPLQQFGQQQNGPNPFFGTASGGNMQQQFSNMSLNGTPVAKQGTAPVAPHVWQ